MHPAFNALASVAVLACVLVLPASVRLPAVAADAADESDGDPHSATQAVAGSGVHFLTTAVIHSKELTPAGMIQRSTETVELSGDLTGRVLYHPTSVFDFVKGTLVNTGHQVFSGTVLGSAPVLIHDDRFRFDVDLNTGATIGEVHLTDAIAGPKVRCHLQVVGTGMTIEGNATFDYTGTCKFKNR